MKKIFTLIIEIVFLTTILNSQVAPPQSFSFRAIITGFSGQTVVDKLVRLRISILQDDMNGFPVYSEFFTPTTDHYSQVNVEIGRGNVLSGIFSSIDWSVHKYFIKIEVDAKGGTNYQLLSVTQLLSVPYALYAENAGNTLSGNYNDLSNRPTNLSQFNNDQGFLTNESDPIFSGHPASGINGSFITNWTNAFNWGNHALAGYIKSYTETDPIFINHVANGITNLQINNWNNAYSWGNHVGLYRPITYVPSWDEITGLPFNINSPSSEQLLRFNIISNKWVNWTPNFLSAEIDGDPSNEIQTITIDGNVISLSKGGSSVSLPSSGVASGQYYYRDKDNDTYGDSFIPVWVPAGITPPLGFVITQSDCNDNNPTIHPGTIERCGDGIDQDCNGNDLDCNPNWHPGDPWIDPQDLYAYKTVQIGTQVWMAENLRATKYNDGTAIPIVIDNTEWAGLSAGAYCWVNNDQTTYPTYGVLYNRWAVNSSNLCPIGWEVPTDEDWSTLIDYLGGTSVAGGKMKITGTTYWQAPNTDATNESGFTALPTGRRTYLGDVLNFKNASSWWHSNIVNNSYNNFTGLVSSNGTVIINNNLGNDGVGVRCIKH